MICGPTAAGKSAIALQIARNVGASIISADSRQIYRGFDIGTAKPSVQEQSAVRHYCIDTVEPVERYSAASWAAEADRAIDESFGNGAVPLVVGGTGFYLRALFTPLFEEPHLDGDRRAALLRELDMLPTEELRRWCAALDADRSRYGRTQLLRAIEVALLAGQRLSVLHSQRARRARWRARYLLVDPGTTLGAAMEERVHDMIANGWLEEVAQLDARTPADAPAWKATGYRSMRDVTRGIVKRDSAVRDVVIATRQYAKRQRTWFRHQLAGADVTLLDSGSPDAHDVAMDWFNDRESIPR